MSGMGIDLSGKVALVTGASKGIGRAIALALGDAGASVVVNYKGSENSADEVAHRIQNNGGESLAWCADVGNASQVESMVEGIVSRFGRLDILINSAGIIRDFLLLQMESKDWDDVLKTNLWGVYHCSKAASRRMMIGRWGRIVNLSSVVSGRGRKGQTNYAASKGAIDAFTRSLASELGPKGITVNAIAPGLIETDMTQGILSFTDQWVRERVALRRMGKPEDVASVAVFLASENAGYITGQVITVDGGIN